MTVNLSVPFFSNTPDDTHCYQAALRMILKYFQPDREYSWAELDDITTKQPDKWTWTMSGLVWLTEQGFEVLNIEDFNYLRFAAEGKAYLAEKFGPAIADEQEKHSILEIEQKKAKEFINEVTTQLRLPNVDEIYQLLDDGYVLIANINAESINNEPGYVGHYVVIKGYNKHGLLIHDPGLPGLENRQVSEELFLKGWDYPDKSARNLIGIKSAQN